MANMTPEQRALVVAIQEDFAALKSAARQISVNSRKLGKINREAGQIRASNDAMRVEGAADAILGAAKKAHADASDALCGCYDDGGPVVLGGGGGRG